MTGWSIRYGLPAQVVDLLVRGGVLKHTGYTAATEELVRLCKTREGRARVLSLAAVRGALRDKPQGGVEDNVWTGRDMIAFVRTGAVPGWLEAEYQESQRLDAHAEELARRTRIDLHTVGMPIAGLSRRPRLPRGGPHGRSTRRASTTRRSRAIIRGSPSPSSSDGDSDPPGLAAYVLHAVRGRS